MDFRLALLALVVVFTASQGAEVDDEIEISEEHIKEKIQVLDDRVIMHVPEHSKVNHEGKHVTLEEVKVLFADNLDYTVSYYPKSRRCHVEKADEDENKPKAKEMAEILKKVNHKLPHNGKVHEKIFRPGSCDVLFAENPDLNAAAEKFCGAEAEIFCDKAIKGLDSEGEAIRIALESKTDERKRTMVREFLACDPSSTMHIMTCSHTKLKATCRFKTRSCIYQLNCPLDPSSGYWNCAYSHEFSKIECCDYGCQR